MHKERLQKLATFLREKVDPDRFDIDSWANECGTAACAWGYASMIWPSEVKLVQMARVDEEQPGYYIPAYCRPGEPEEYGFEGAAEFFDITYGDSVNLFCPTSYDHIKEEISPADVADQIENLIRLVELEARMNQRLKAH